MGSDVSLLVGVHDEQVNVAMECSVRDGLDLLDVVVVKDRVGRVHAPCVVRYDSGTGLCKFEGFACIGFEQVGLKTYCMNEDGQITRSRVSFAKTVQDGRSKPHIVCIRLRYTLLSNLSVAPVMENVRC